MLHFPHGKKILKYDKNALLIDLKTLLSLACVVQTTNLKKLGRAAKITV